MDIAKGAAAVALLGAWARGPTWLPVALGAAAVLGHIYSPFVRFRGGKGVATAGGMFLALAPLAVLIALLVWGITLWLTGFVSVSSIVTVLTFPVWVRLTEPGASSAFWASVAVALLIVFAHRDNIKRLAGGRGWGGRRGKGRRRRALRASDCWTVRPMSRIAVVGGGAWGTVLADLLTRKGEAVTLWAREPEVVAAINRDHVNPLFLPDAPLAPTLRATGDLAAAVREAEVVVSAAPSHAVRVVMAEAARAATGKPLVVSVSKGLEPDRLVTLSCVLDQVFGSATPLAVLSGPSFAREVYQRQPTAVVAAAADEAVARRVQQVFSSAHLRVYTHTDVLGVELGGALKNVIALAAGIVEGLGMGHNPRAALITRGLAEITRLGVALGADPLTFAGLAGMGDLILTATGALSRNRTLGVELGQGRTLEQAQAGRQSVAEGVLTARAAVALADRHEVELPISREVAAILFEGKAPREAIADLMERDLKAEQWR